MKIIAVLIITAVSFVRSTPGFAGSPSLTMVQVPVNEAMYTGCGGVIAPNVNEAYMQEVVKLVNDERTAAGLQPLRRVLQLDQAAQYHATDMAQDNYFEHDTYDTGEKPVCTWVERVTSYYENWDLLGENIAYGYTTPKEVMDGWMGSQDHRDNILNPNFNEIGVGYYLGGPYGSYWVQDFGSRSNVPELGNIPASLNFFYSIEDGRLIPETYRIRPEDIGTGLPVTWNTGDNRNWLFTSPNTGTYPDDFIVSLSGFNTTEPGTYSGMITVTASGPVELSGLSKDIFVNLRVITGSITQVYLPLVQR